MTKAAPSLDLGCVPADDAFVEELFASLDGVPLRLCEPARPVAERVNAETVDLIRDFLAQAERGELVGVVIAATTADGASLISHTQHLASHEVIGLLETAKLDFYEMRASRFVQDEDA